MAEDKRFRRLSCVFRRVYSVLCIPSCVFRRPYSVVWELVGLGRFELPTSRLSSARSNQLSYKPAPGFRSQSSPGSVVTGFSRHRFSRHRFSRHRFSRHRVQSSPGSVVAGPAVSGQIRPSRPMAHLWRLTSGHRPLAWARPRRKRNVDGGVPLSGDRCELR
jgi:hypothetical protein